MNVAAYIRVSTQDQAENGHGLDAQRAAIAKGIAARKGWTLGRVVLEEGSSVRKRPALAALLEEMDAGTYDVLMVSKLDRLSRSTLEFMTLVERARREGWRLVMLEPDLDIETPMGECMVTVLAAFATMERRLISQRTKEGLAAAIAKGAKPGRPVQMDPRTEAYIGELRAQGVSLRKICARLEEEGIPTPSGTGSWEPKAVMRALKRMAAA